MRIQHNIMAMNAYRNYNTNTSAVSRNLEKLSSGYKINRAGDDAAGLAISEKMRAQITGLDAAQKNVKDGISLVKTAEGALQEVQDMLNRMVYLATQSANGTYDNEVDRANLQKEVDQLNAEIDRIADSANFNGIKLLDGSLDTTPEMTSLEAGAGGLEAVLDGTAPVEGEGKPGVFKLDLSKAEWTNDGTNATTAPTLTVELGGNKFVITGTAKNGFTGADVATAIANEINTKDTGNKVAFTAGSGDSKISPVTGTGATATKAKVGDIEYIVEDDGNGVLTFTQVTPTEFAEEEMVFEVSASTLISKNANDEKNVGNQGFVQAVTVSQEPVVAGGKLYAQAQFTLTADMVQDGGVLQIGDETYTFAVGADSKFIHAANVVDLTDLEAGDEKLLIKAAARLSDVADSNSAVHVEADIGESAIIYLTEKDGGIDYAEWDLIGTPGDAATDDAPWTNKAGESFVKYGLADAGAGLTLQIGDTSDHYNQLTVSVSDMHAAALGVSSIDITTQAGASDAINKIKAAINSVSMTRGTLGATQNRLEHTQNNLSVMEENIQDAESTIRDTDIAEEMMAYTKNNILVQSAQAMLAQANQIPQGVLQLLG